MKIYFVVSYGHEYLKEYTTGDRYNFLLSYYFISTSKVENWEYIKETEHKKIFLDSGAYSAITKGIKINIDDYISFIKENQKHIELYANLDSIGDWKTTMDNQRYMESRGLSPLPVYHYGEPKEVLEELCKRYEYIALGGLVGASVQNQEQWLSLCFSIIKRYWPKKIHGFGINSVRIWKQFPFYSVDSTRWILQAAKYASILRFENGTLKGYQGFGRKKVKKKDMKNYDLIMAHKDEEGDKKYQSRVLQNMLAIEEAAKWVTKLWDERNISWNENGTYIGK